jgi:hypothetical protein
MECPVCYCNKVSCTLVCGHSFCKSCVKTWYYKCDEPSCPMCRRTLYFKGMHKVVEEWDDERATKKNEDAFNKAFDEIFFDEESDLEDEAEAEAEDESDGDGDDSESWETDTQGSFSDIGEPPVVGDDENKWTFQESSFYSNYILGEIVFLQKEFKKAEELGLDFEWYLENSWLFEIEPSRTMYVEDDIFPHFKNLFVSNHKGTVQNKRVGKRVSAKTDTHFTTVFVVVF